MATKRWAFAQGLMVGVAVTIVVVLVAGAVYTANQRRQEASSLQQDYARLALKIPNLRLFPGWGQSDAQVFQFSRCTVTRVDFTGDASQADISVRIQNRSAISTKPSVEVCLFDREGAVISSAMPVDYLLETFSPGEVKDMPESFGELSHQPVFYCVGEHKD